jgi:hypothetical protein
VIPVTVSFNLTFHVHSMRDLFAINNFLRPGGMIWPRSRTVLSWISREAILLWKFKEYRKSVELRIYNPKVTHSQNALKYTSFIISLANGNFSNSSFINAPECKPIIIILYLIIPTTTSPRNKSSYSSENHISPNARLSPQQKIDG